ncbi:MAG: hypothetical protein KF777_12270 [Planctomycetaceae bacterium]|nr:hypothetical protein [Planctomycetaceae bacterium]
MDYHFRSLGKTCAATGQPLAPGSLCHSVVVDEQGLLKRLDFSEEGWTGQPPQTVAHWRTRVPDQPAGATVPIDPDSLFRYFEQLSEEASPGTEETRYVLALHLLKHRRLTVVQAHGEADDELLELSGTHGEGQFFVRNLHLDDAAVGSLQNVLRQQLATEWS